MAGRWGLWNNPCATHHSRREAQLKTSVALAVAIGVGLASFRWGLMISSWAWASALSTSETNDFGALQSNAKPCNLRYRLPNKKPEIHTTGWAEPLRSKIAPPPIQEHMLLGRPPDWVYMAHNHGYKFPKYGFGLSGFEMEVMGKRLMAPARSCPLSSESCPNMRMGMLPGMWPTRFASQNRSAQPPRKQRRAKWLRAGPTAKVPHVTAWLHGGQEWLWLMSAINNSCCINKILYIVLREAACLYLQPDGLVATSCNMFTLVFVRGANIDKHGPLHFDAVTSRPCSQRQNNILCDAALMHYMGHLDCVWTAT